VAGSGELIFYFLGIVFILIGLSIMYMISIKSYKLYRERRQFQPLVFTFACFFLATGMIFLIFETYYISIAKDETLGIVFGGLSMVFVIFALIAFDYFTFNIAFLEKFRLLASIATICGGLLIGFWVFDPTKEIVAGDITFGDWWGIGIPITVLIFLIVSIILMVVPITSLLYYSKKNWKEDPVLGKRLLLIALGGMSLGIAYTAEVVGFNPIITTILRISNLFTPILLYWALFRLKEPDAS
jgi:hypothetical protein